MAAAAHPPLAGYAIHRGRPDITLAGSYCRDPSAIVSKAGLQARAAAPRTRHQRHEVRAKKSPSGSFFLSAATTTSTPFRAPVSVCGAGCARGSRGSGIWGRQRHPRTMGVFNVACACCMCMLCMLHVACTCTCTCTCTCACLWARVPGWGSAKGHSFQTDSISVHVCGLEFLG